MILVNTELDALPVLASTISHSNVDKRMTCMLRWRVGCRLHDLGFRVLEFMIWGLDTWSQSSLLPTRRAVQSRSISLYSS